MNIYDQDLINYDNIIDLWYSWLYSRIHYLIVKNVIMKYDTRMVLDIGCGTGFQSFLHSAFGSNVFGIDISKKMLSIAKNKRSRFHLNNFKLFPDEFNFVKKYNSIISSYLKNSQTKKYRKPHFLMASVYDIPFQDQTFDHINCCGSVLSLIEDTNTALKEMSRVLRKGGTMFIEVESKWTIDRLWSLLDSSIMNNKIGYYSNFKDDYSSTLFYPLKDSIINYPFGEYKKPIFIRLKLFNYITLKKELSYYNLNVLKRWTIHSVTNFIPSVFLDTNNPSYFLQKIFNFLSLLEEKIPFYLPGCSMILLLKKGK